MRDIKARMPPSPLLSARMTNRQYLIDTVMINVHTTSERMPSAESGVNLPPVACTTVCKEYRGLVPRSPKTPPKALSAAHRPGCAGWLDSRLGERSAITPVLLVLHVTVSGNCDRSRTNR